MNVFRGCVLGVLVASLGASSTRGDEPGTGPARRNVILVTADGLRWQEIFRGAERSLFNKEDGGVEDVDTLRREFWRETPEARREALMPFLWKTIALQGQIYGNVDKGSQARVTNGLNFSYPGYNEMLTGSPDPRIDSNKKNLNPNINVLEWLNGRPGFRSKVAAIGSWDVYPYILNQPRNRLPMNNGWEPIVENPLTEREQFLNRLMAQTPRTWPDCRNDAFTFPVAMEYIKRHSPRVLYIGLGDTDEHAHAGRYDLYLQSAHHTDANLELLWNELQARPEYRGNTTLLLSTDHGRGDPPRGWRDHGEKVTGAEAIWIAAIGPDTPALGEQINTSPVTQSQVAATMAAAVGEDFVAGIPKAARPITDLIKPAAR